MLRRGLYDGGWRSTFVDPCRLHPSTRGPLKTPAMHLPRSSAAARALLACLLFALPNSSAADEPAGAVKIAFERQIRPLLLARCGKCHGPQQQEGGLRLDARGAALRGGDSGLAIAPGKLDESELWRRVTSDDEAEQMPPEGARLSAANSAISMQATAPSLSRAYCPTTNPCDSSAPYRKSSAPS